MLSSFTRVAVAGAAAATMLAATATPASADSDIILKTSRGYMLYHDDGDVFKICDTNADGHGVEGQLISTFTGYTYLYIDDGGDAGCDKKGYDVKSDHYAMQFWWGGDGVVHSSKVFSE
ncbi:hypothetical protein ABZ465_03015 [Streptomyces griseoincarnatus]